MILSLRRGSEEEGLVKLVVHQGETKTAILKEIRLWIFWFVCLFIFSSAKVSLMMQESLRGSPNYDRCCDLTRVGEALLKIFLQLH